MSESLAKKKRATVDIRNVNHPGKVTRVDADKYMAMIVIGGPWRIRTSNQRIMSPGFLRGQKYESNTC